MHFEPLWFYAFVKIWRKSCSVHIHAEIRHANANRNMGQVKHAIFSHTSSHKSKSIVRMRRYKGQRCRIKIGQMPYIKPCDHLITHAKVTRSVTMIASDASGLVCAQCEMSCNVQITAIQYCDTAAHHALYRPQYLTFHFTFSILHIPLLWLSVRQMSHCVQLKICANWNQIALALKMAMHVLIQSQRYIVWKLRARQAGNMAPKTIAVKQRQFPIK